MNAVEVPGVTLVFATQSYVSGPKQAELFAVIITDSSSQIKSLSISKEANTFLTAICCVVVFVQPKPSVQVSETVYKPLVGKVCVGEGSFPVKSITPSLSQSQSLCTIEVIGAVEASVAVKLCPIQTVSGIVNPPRIPCTVIV